ncbi:calcium uptake protein 1 homolog, mitochondrial [Scaptodrosophila lebanonensis]|uniref:Calcium uptake protein 1 homolog, mitochondrial n=1 Tax=Drosophila lebanonensis TaxID=7225 RepID=A0A6J2T4J8_DROLE|nr:calcium uptake protein 1 homolog, mitochondrial [Scaptodrosophila lebanonensis]
MCRRMPNLLYYTRLINAVLVCKWNNHRTCRLRHRKLAFSFVPCPCLSALNVCAILALANIRWRKWMRSVHCTSVDEKEVATKRKDTYDTLRRILAFLYERIVVRNSPKAEPCEANSERYKGHRATFRDITIQEYENRLRSYSMPDKIFRYFATIKMKNEAGRWEIFMTPRDFLRAITPGLRQPENLGLDRFRKVDQSHINQLPLLPKDSIFYKFRSDGLLTFGDYVFLVMLMSISERYFEIGFRLFDRDGDGDLTKEDLRFMTESVGNGDGVLTNHNLSRYFFGQNHNQTCSIEKFQQFQQQVHEEVHKMEFNMLAKKTGANNKKAIGEVAFAKMLLSYARMPIAEKTEILKRIQKKFTKNSQGISLTEFLMFFKFVKDMAAIDTALTFYYLSGANISRSTLRQVSHVVVGVSLSDHLIDVIYTVFDTDNNGILSRSEFISVLRDRSSGRIKKNKSIGLAQMLSILYRCAVDTSPI